MTILKGREILIVNNTFPIESNFFLIGFVYSLKPNHMRSLYTLSFLLLFCAIAPAKATTDITAPTISGHWTASGSPYRIFNDVRVPSGQYLHIGPGVEVILQGAYRIYVDGGMIARGTATQPIRFHVQDTVGWHNSSSMAGAWAGIYYTAYNSADFGGTADSSTIEYCNVEDMKGEGLRIDYRSFRFKNCAFTHNKSAVSSNMDPVHSFEMDNCQFYNNLLPGGGCVSCVQGSVNVHNCSFFDNKLLASVMGSFNCQSVFRNNKIYRNMQLADHSGGAISVTGSALVEHNQIYENTFTDNAAICLWDGTGDIVNNYICNNQTSHGYSGTWCGYTQGGGAIRLQAYMVPAAKYTVRNNIIANNHAELGGGGIYILEADVDIFNNDIVHNTGIMGGGVYIYNPTQTVRIKNNILYKNVGFAYGYVDTATLFISAGSAGNILYEQNWARKPFCQEKGLFYGFTGSIVGDTLTNMVADDPGFVSMSAMPGIGSLASPTQFHLAAASACINAGDTTGTLASATDYAGNSRISGSAIDIGACEYQFASTHVQQATGRMEAMALFPNPATTVLFFNLAEPKGSITLLDATGRVVMQAAVMNKLTPINLNGIAPGIYIATWRNGSMYVSQQVAIK